MQVKQWGPSLWIPIHCMTFNYNINPTEEDKKLYKNFFTLLGDMLPCKYCKESYNIYIKYLPIDQYLDSREGACYWLFTLHNLVNEKTFKPMANFVDVCIKYEKMRAKCGKVMHDDQEYQACILQYNSVNMTEINNFVNKAIERYGKMTEEYIKKLRASPENPKNSITTKNIKIKKYILVK